jgi:hypothetical protein
MAPGMFVAVFFKKEQQRQQQQQGENEREQKGIKRRTIFSFRSLVKVKTLAAGFVMTSEQFALLDRFRLFLPIFGAMSTG